MRGNLYVDVYGKGKQTMIGSSVHLVYPLIKQKLSKAIRYSVDIRVFVSLKVS